MNDVRGWIEKKLQEEGYLSTRLPSSQLEIMRAPRPNARVICIGLGDGERFDADDLRARVDVVQDTTFVVVVPTRISHAAYERAEELGICVAGFGELLDALEQDDDIADHVDSQERYERRRLTFNSEVKSIKRKGHHAYEVTRCRRRPLTIITTNNYEFTADQLYSLLESYAGIDADLIVVTNPNCRGFSTD
ncbi:hypothetical protein [Micromonospora sp. NBC_01412]|uniref:hypothetical protein n=1 Tax=Micromonospora sp. NBC_01412 TaxID=2903590 RepID=UPI0032444AEF